MVVYLSYIGGDVPCVHPCLFLYSIADRLKNIGGFMQYSRAFVFSKHTDLLPYFFAHYSGCKINDEQYARIQSNYKRERAVQLILLVRYVDNKIIARIKCPINPMPVKGEFEASSMESLFAFMRNNGWTHKETYNLAMFH